MVGTEQTLGSKILIYGVLIAIALAWTVPTVGLLVSSFRPGDDVTKSGWWSVATNPADAGF